MNEMNEKSHKTYVSSETIEENVYAIPSGELGKISSVFGLPLSEREKLAAKLKTIMGELVWNITDGEFRHPETNLVFTLDATGFVYQQGLSDAQEKTLWDYPAATCVLECGLDNNLEFWINRGLEVPKIYLMTDYKSGASHQTPRMRDQLEQILLGGQPGVSAPGTVLRFTMERQKSPKAATEKKPPPEPAPEKKPPPDSAPGTKTFDLDEG
jgi:hypothetical protein